MNGTGLVIVIILLVVLALTSPTAEQHQQFLMNEVTKETASKPSILGAFVGLIGMLSIPSLEYKDYLIFSTMGTKDHVITIGIMNHVFLAETPSTPEP